MIHRYLPILCALALVAAPQAARAVQPQAPIYRDIDVDGDLSDWPGDLPTYRITNAPAAYHGARVDGPQDLSGSFRVAYDPDADIIYLAVVVRDDELVVGSDHRSTDACEVYLSDLVNSRARPSQAVLVPGHGTNGYGSAPNRAGTVLQAAFSRDGDVTSYEWALRVRGSGDAADLAPGRELGFDVVLVDKDGNDPSAWVPWGNMATSKVAGADRMGRLLLTNDQAGGSLLARLGAWLAGGSAAVGWFALLGLALGAGAVGGYLGQRARAGGQADHQLAEIERRLGDIQEVVIALAEHAEHEDARAAQ